MVHLSKPVHSYPLAHSVYYEFYFPGQIIRGHAPSSASMLVAHTPNDVPILLQVLEEKRLSGWRALGFLTYEAGYAFHSGSIPELHPLNMPASSRGQNPPYPDQPSQQIAFGSAMIHDTSDQNSSYPYKGTSFEGLPLAWFILLPPGASEVEPAPYIQRPFSLGPHHWSIDLKTYQEHIATIQEHIQKGVLQTLNYTAQAQAQWHGDTLTFFHRLRNAQKGQYHAYIDLGDWVIASVSPELFFSWHHDTLLLRPMKGTARRGRYWEEDQHIREALKHSFKNRTENELTVQGMHHEMKALSSDDAEPVVQSAFDIEIYPHIFQMTSTLKTQLRPGTGLTDILKVLFPSGSIAGYPKREALYLTRQLEKTRGVYTGTIGVITPQATIFNIAIRTALIHRPSGRLTFGSGSGITLRSQAEDEYAEMQLKTNILEYARIYAVSVPSVPSVSSLEEQQQKHAVNLLSPEEPQKGPTQKNNGHKTMPFALLETMRLEDGRLPLGAGHLRRLEKSMRYYHDRFPSVDERLSYIQQLLSEAKRHFTDGVYRLRLIVPEESEHPLSPDSNDPSHLKSNAMHTKMFQQSSLLDNLQFQKTEDTWIVSGKYGIRLEISVLSVPWDGRNRITVARPHLDDVTIPPLPAYLAARPIDCQDPRFFHKTLDRAHYEPFFHTLDHPSASNRAQYNVPSASPQTRKTSLTHAHHRPYDIVLYNAHGHITELTRANLVILKDHRLLTPPLDDGLLAGVYRGELLAAGIIEEHPIHLEDLQTAQHIWAINALRGWMRVELFEAPFNIFPKEVSHI